MDTKYTYPENIHSVDDKPLENYYQSCLSETSPRNRGKYTKFGLPPDRYYESHHLKEYAQYLLTNKRTTKLTKTGRPTTKDDTYKKNRGRLDELFKANKYDKGWDEFSRMPSGQGAAKETQEQVFQSLADYQRIHFFRCFLGFLEFCRDNDRPLYQAFDFKEFWHEETIARIKAYEKATLPETKERLDTTIQELSAYLDCHSNEQLDQLHRRPQLGDINGKPPKVSGGVSGSEKTLPNETVQRNTHRYPIDTSDANWLSPRNETFIPFVERGNELDELDAFAKGNPDDGNVFQLWAVVGPSGAGKTRLLTHWANRDIYDEWEAIDVRSKTNIDWANWSPKCPTLISIDYIYGYDKVIADIIARMEDATFIYPVRLLLLDHATPDTMAELLKDPRWGFEEKRAEDFSSMENRFFFKQAPLKLEVLKKNSVFLAKIICTVAYKGEDGPFKYIDNPVVQRGVTYLKNTEAMWEPLFAALVGDAIKNGRDNGENAENYLALNRRALMEHYLQGKTRLTWLLEDKVKGAWAACFMAAATARNGVGFETLLQAASKKSQKVILENYKEFKSLCNGVVSNNDPVSLKAFQPDIFGETHFLLLLQEIIEGGLLDFKDKLPALIASEANDTTDKSASEFIAFTTRLARNLSNDDQSNIDTIKYWGLLDSFLAPGKFKASRSFKWAKSMACFEIYLILKDKEQEEWAENFLNQVDAEELYFPPKEQIEARNIELAIQYFGLKKKEGEAIPASLIYLLALWDGDQSRDYTALMLSLLAKNSTIADYLIAQGTDVKVERKNGWTALMIACRHDQEAVALKLVEADANLEAQNNEKLTALMLACRHDQEAVALKLVEADANLKAQNNEKWTALMYACRHDQEAVALKLVDKGANLEAQNDEKLTALVYACRYNQEKVALKLVDKNANLKAKTKDNWTALMVACRYAQEAVALKLVEKKDANLGAQNNEKWTALMFACRHDQEAVALKLVEKKDANLGAQDNENWTALMIACRYDQEAVALKLVGEGVDVNCKSKIGQTILMFAVFANQKNVVRALLDKMVNMNDVYENNGVEVTALGLARGLEHHEIIKMLEDAGALELPPYEPAS